MSEQSNPAGGAQRAGGEAAHVANGQAAFVAALGGFDTAAAHRTEFLALLGASHARLWLVAAAVTGDRTEADDVLQDAAMIGLAKFSDFTPGSSFDAWMGQITRNVALNALRKRKRAAAVVSGQANSAESGVGLRVHSHDRNDAGPGGKSEELADAVAGLDDVARTCLLLRVVGGLPYQAIAAIVQIPESTAMSHVYRSRGQLRQWLMRIEDQAIAGPRGPEQRLEQSSEQGSGHGVIVAGLPRTPGSGVAR